LGELERKKTGGQYNFLFQSVNEVSGVQGQGTENPFSDFDSHTFIELLNPKFNNPPFYDPSYGLTYNSIEDFENSAVEGFYIYRGEKILHNELAKNADLDKDGVISDKNVRVYEIHFRKNNSNIQDIK